MRREVERLPSTATASTVSLPVMIQSPTMPVPETDITPSEDRSTTIARQVHRDPTLPWRAVDLFCNWGAATHFATRTGFRVVSAFDNCHDAMVAHSKIFMHSCKNREMDVNDMTKEDLEPDLDLLLNYIPCSGSSRQSVRFGLKRKGTDADDTNAGLHVFKLLQEMEVPPKFILIENPEGILDCPAATDGRMDLPGDYFRMIKGCFFEVAAYRDDEYGYSHLEWATLHSDVRVYSSPRVYIVAVRNDVWAKIAAGGLVFKERLAPFHATADSVRRGGRGGVDEPNDAFVYSQDGEKASNRFNRMLSKGKGPVVVLPGEGAFRLASGAAVELHGLPLEFADSQRLFGKDGETKCFKLLGLSAVASSLRPLQCIARSLELFKRCTEGDDGADGGDGRRGAVCGLADHVIGRIENPYDTLTVFDGEKVSKMPRCGLVTSDPTTELAIWKRYETQAEAEYMEDASVLQLVRRWKGTPGYLTKLTADEMRLQLVEPSWRSCLRGRKMAKNDFCLHEMSVLAAKFVKQPEIGTGDVLEITWVGGTKHKAKVLLGRDSFLPRLDYEDGWNCRCVIWPTTKTGGLVYHFLDPKASLESEKTSMEYTLVERKSVNVRGRAKTESEVEGVAETRRRLKAQLQELKQTCGHGRERLPHVDRLYQRALNRTFDVEKLYVKSEGEPKEVWETILKGFNARCTRHRSVWVCKGCGAKYDKKSSVAVHAMRHCTNKGHGYDEVNGRLECQRCTCTQLIREHFDTLLETCEVGVGG